MYVSYIHLNDACSLKSNNKKIIQKSNQNPSHHLLVTFQQPAFFPWIAKKWAGLWGRASQLPVTKRQCNASSCFRKASFQTASRKRWTTFRGGDDAKFRKCFLLWVNNCVNRRIEETCAFCCRIFAGHVRKNNRRELQLHWFILHIFVAIPFSKLPTGNTGSTSVMPLSSSVA